MSVIELLFRRTRATIILAGITMLALGVAMFVAPIGATILIVQTVGWILVVAGVCSLINCWLHRLPVLIQADLVAGLAALLPGICMLAWPEKFVTAVYVIIGVLIALTGVNDCIEAFDIKNAGLSNWGWMLVLGIITVIVGATVVASPFAFAEFVMLIAGCALIFDGITEIISGVRMGQLKKIPAQMQAAAQQAADEARAQAKSRMGADATVSTDAPAATGATGVSQNGAVIPAQNVSVEDNEDE